MTSPLVPQASITLEGKEYHMRLDLNALSDFESMTGKSIMRGGLTDISNLELSDARALLWACMVQEDESLTIRQVGRLISVNNLAELVETIQSLVSGAMPEAPEEGQQDASPLTETGSVPQGGGLDSTPPESRTSD